MSQKKQKGGKSSKSSPSDMRRKLVGKKRNFSRKGERRVKIVDSTTKQINIFLKQPKPKRRTIDLSGLAALLMK